MKRQREGKEEEDEQRRIVKKANQRVSQGQKDIEAIGRPAETANRGDCPRLTALLRERGAEAELASDPRVQVAGGTTQPHLL